MKRTGTVLLPLHHGRAPRWLFERMRALSKSIVEAIVIEFGPDELLYRLSDPNWFQALGCLLGFDWHSSGVTTTTMGALKEAIKGMEGELGIFIAGGKGKVALETPKEIERKAERYGFDPLTLKYASRMTAKVDSTALQDGYSIYHHTIIFTTSGKWAVVEQGMNEKNRYARRYHWLSENLKSFVEDPHSGIWAKRREKFVLNLVSSEAREAREVITQLSREKPEKIEKEILKLIEYPKRHILSMEDISPKWLSKVLLKTYERQPENFEELLGVKGLGPKTLRALALLSDVIYGAKPSYEDPIIYSFAHGGKDGTPYPVNRRLYDRTIEVLESAIKKAKIGSRDKLDALKKLSALFPEK